MLASSTHGLCRAAGAAVLVLTFAALSAGAAPPTLPNEDQVRVNQAIDRGVAFLKATQNPVGTWGNPKGPGAGKGWAVGYTALPGLTLLECGLPPNHPQIQAAARLVRTLAPQLDHTYEISLAILFLDKLGDPKDKRVIQSLAARLIAGQAHSGGWGYRCPNPLKEFPPGYQTAMLDMAKQLPSDA